MKDNKKLVFISGIDRNDVSSMNSASSVKELMANEQLINDDRFEFISIYHHLGNDYFKLNDEQFKEKVSSIIMRKVFQDDVVVLFRSIKSGESDHIELVNIRESWSFIEEIAHSGVLHSIIKNNKHDEFNVMRRFVTEDVCQNVLTVVINPDNFIHFSYVIKIMFDRKVVNSIGNCNISNSDIYNENISECFEFLCPFDGFFTRKNSDIFVASNKSLSYGKLIDIEMNEYWFKDSSYSGTKNLELSMENIMKWKDKKYFVIFQAPSGFYKTGDCLMKFQLIPE